MVSMPQGRPKKHMGPGSATYLPCDPEQVAELLWTRVCPSFATLLVVVKSIQCDTQVKKLFSYEAVAKPIPAQTMPLSELENHASSSGQTQILAWAHSSASKDGWTPASISLSAGHPPAVNNLDTDHGHPAQYTSLSCFFDSGLLLPGN